MRHDFSVILSPPVPSAPAHFSSAMFLLSLHPSVHKRLLQQDSAEPKWNRTQWGDLDPHVLSHCVCLRYRRSAGLARRWHAGHSLWQVRHPKQTHIQAAEPHTNCVLILQWFTGAIGMYSLCSSRFWAPEAHRNSFHISNETWYKLMHKDQLHSTLNIRESESQSEGERAKREREIPECHTWL